MTWMLLKFNTVEGLYFRPSSSNVCVGLAVVFLWYATLASCAPARVLLLGQVDGGRLRPDGDPVFVQHFDQHLSDVFVVRVKVKDVPHHIGQTLIGEFLLGKCERRGHTEENLLQVGS